MLKAKVYLETTIVSYLVATPSADLIQAAHQQATRNWWAGRSRFDLFVSRAVVSEAGRGDRDAAARRMEALQGIPNLQFGREVAALAKRLMQPGPLPPKARLDAVHVAVAAVNGMDYLLTWNLRHLANAALRVRIEDVCRMPELSRRLFARRRNSWSRSHDAPGSDC